MSELDDRRHDLMSRWRVSVDEWLNTPSSLIGLGRRDAQPVVLKVVKMRGDEWNAGAVVAAFDAQGMVRVFEYESGAMLLERAVPGTSLVDIVRAGHDEAAVDVIAGVMAGMRAREIPHGCATAEYWGRAFAIYRATGDTQLAAVLVESAETIYFDLCATQRETCLLHGDLQHYNVLLDDARGWLTIDPKGVVAEQEFEVGPFLRNPHGMPSLCSDRAVVTRRLTHLCRALDLDYGRALRWSYAQSVLSAIWDFDDTGAIDHSGPALALARTIEPLLGDSELSVRRR